MLKSCGSWLGPLAVAVTGGFVLLYLPPSPAALTWPFEWGIIAAWVVAGGAVFMPTVRSAAWRDQRSRARALLGEFARQAD
jgi:hypothetical protein